MKDALRARLLVASLALAAFGVTLSATGFVRDDRWLIAENPLILQGLTGVPRHFTTGYVEAVMGRAAPIQEYRPLLTLSYLAHYATTGLAKAPMHLANVLLHVLVCLLLWEGLRRRLAPAAAIFAAAVFALLPIHAEVVSYISSRSELLAAASVLGAWLLLSGKSDGKRLLAGLAVYAAGLLSKEHALLFPFWLALSDWVLDGELPWSPRRRKVYAALLAVAAVYFGIRILILGRPAHGGVPYFAGGGRLIPALSTARFFVERYLTPALSGVGLCSDFNRPMIPDAATNSARAWTSLAVLAGGAILAARAAAARKPWGFWALAPMGFLLPTSHLIIPLDTLGAERLFYLPSVSLAVALGALYERARRIHPRAAAAAGGALLLWYLGAVNARNLSWLSERAFYEAAIACNPSSAKAHGGLGAHLLAQGDGAGGAMLERAIALDPGLGTPHYNLAVAAHRAGRLEEAERRVAACLERSPEIADAWLLKALLAGARGRRAEERAALERAVAIMPEHPAARFNLGRALLLSGAAAEAAAHLRRFVELAPHDPDAEPARRILSELEAAR